MNSEHPMKTLFTFSVSFLLICFSLTGCSSPQYWAKPGAKAGDFDRDVVDCKRTLAGSQGRRVFSLRPSTLLMEFHSLPLTSAWAKKDGTWQISHRTWNLLIRPGRLPGPKKAISNIQQGMSKLSTHLLPNLKSLPTRNGFSHSVGSHKIWFV